MFATAIEPDNPALVEIVQARRQIAELEAANRELLAIADNSALNLALGRIAELEDALRWIAGRLALGRTAGRSAPDLLGIEEHARAVLKGASNDPA